MEFYYLVDTTRTSQNDKYEYEPIILQVLNAADKQIEYHLSQLLHICESSLESRYPPTFLPPASITGRLARGRTPAQNAMGEVK